MYKYFYEAKRYMYKNRNNFNLFLLIGSFVLIILLLLLFYTNIYAKNKEEFKSNREQIVTLEKDKEKLVEIRNNYSVIKKKINDMTTTKEALKNLLPKRGNIPDIISQISLAAEKSNVSIVGMARTTDNTFQQGADKFQRVSFDIDCHGEHVDIITFLDYLERNKNVFTIGNLKLMPTDKTSEKNDINASFTVDIYLIAEQ